MAADDDTSAIDDILAVLRVVAGWGRDAAGAGIELLGDGLDDALRVLVHHRVERALAPGAAAVHAPQLVEALGPTSSSGSMAQRFGSGGARLARRTRLARSVTSRTPVGMALRFGPGLVDVAAGSLRSLDATAAHLVTRARDARIEPDPDRLRAAVVQVLIGDAVDPDADVDHIALARVWLADAARRLAPLGLGGIRGLNRSRTPEAIIAALSEIDLRQLRPPGRRRRRT